jgi:hypothetical protein
MSMAATKAPAGAFAISGIRQSAKDYESNEEHQMNIITYRKLSPGIKTVIIFARAGPDPPSNARRRTQCRLAQGPPP